MKRLSFVALVGCVLLLLSPLAGCARRRPVQTTEVTDAETSYDGAGERNGYYEADVPPPPTVDEPMRYEPLEPPVQTVEPNRPQRLDESTFPTPRPDAGVVVHEVRRGDTLWKIAGQYYGTSNRGNVQKIVEANPGLNPDVIKVGQKIVIPR